jgi:hypothetical protein
MKEGRKKRLKLDEKQWVQAKNFDQEFFEQHSELASKATYESLIKERQEQYPCIILSKSSFRRHVAPIETLKANAGIPGEVENSRKYYRRVSESFQRILIGLPLDEFKSIKLEGLIQKTNALHPDLHIIDKNRTTLAIHFPIKHLKTLARGLRPAHVPIGQTVQTQEPADPPALGAAAGIERLGER